MIQWWGCESRLGWQIWKIFGSDKPQIGEIWTFFRPVFSTFLTRLDQILNIPRFVPFLTNQTQFRANSKTPWSWVFLFTANVASLMVRGVVFLPVRCLECLDFLSVASHCSGQWADSSLKRQWLACPPLGHQIWTQNGSNWPQMGQILLNLCPNLTHLVAGIFDLRILLTHGYGYTTRTGQDW